MKPVTPEIPAQTLTIYAAASLTEAFTELGQAFERGHPGVQLTFNFAGSQQLAQQINEGAPADVFASANLKQMNDLIESGHVGPDTPQPFATNRLVVIYPSDNPGGLSTLQDLAKPGLRVVLAAQEVPVGQYSVEFLEKAGTEAALGSTYKEAVLANVVSYESDVKVVLAKVALGEADAGLVYASDLHGENAAQIGQIEILETWNVIASYPIAMVKDSPHADLAATFIAFVLSSEGQTILAKYGFGRVLDE